MTMIYSHRRIVSTQFQDFSFCAGLGCIISGSLIENFRKNGIEVGANSATIDGTTAGACSDLSGNANDGVLIDNGVSGVEVQDNSIGTNAAGTAALANSIGIEGAGNPTTR